MRAGLALLVSGVGSPVRALGCDRAMMLDGGISSQLAVRGTDGRVKSWSNFPKVPLAVVGDAANAIA